MKGGRHLRARYKLEAGHELEAGIARPGSWTNWTFGELESK